MMIIRILVTMWRELVQYLSIIILKFALGNVHVCHFGVILNVEEKRELERQTLEHCRITIGRARAESEDKERNTHAK